MLTRIPCPNCWSSLPSYAAGGESAVCLGCGSIWAIQSFPALLREPEKLRHEDLALLEGQASCLHHAAKRASASCSRCGRFLCSLCSLPVGDEIWCAECFQGPRSNEANGKNSPALQTRRTLWDTIALALAVLPIFTIIGWYFLFITAPAAIFLALRYWRRPQSPLPRTKIRFVLAISLALVQFVGWSYVAVMIFRSFRGVAHGGY